MALYAPKSGCPMCSIVSQPYPSLLHSPSFGPSGGIIGGSGATGNNNGPAHIIYKDDNITAYLERNNPVSSKGHVVIMLNPHVPSIYEFSSSDLPLLQHIRELGNSLLSRHLRGDPFTSLNNEQLPPPLSLGSPDTAEKIHVGFIVSPFSDPKIPVKDHVHCHAFVGDMDLAGWWRKLNYSGLAWYAAEDLIAEIREQTSNNRIKSGYENRPHAPIDRVPDAGAAAGLPDGTLLRQDTLSAQSPTSPSSRGRPTAVSVPSIQEDAPFDTDPITPKPGDVTNPSSTPASDAAGRPSIGGGASSARISAAAGKRPMGPRTKESVGSTSNTMQMSPVTTPAMSGSPEPAT